MKKIFLILLLSIFTGFVAAETVIEIPGIMKPGRLTVEGNEVFIVEGHTVNIYSLKPFKLKTKFGNKGEGPGEFKYMLPYILIYPNRILAVDGEKTAWFSREGKFIDEKKIKGETGFRFLPLNKTFVRGESVNFEKLAISLYDNESKKIKTFYECMGGGRRLIAGPNIKEDAEWKMMRHYIDFKYDRGSKKIFVFDGSKGFHITVFDENGNKQKTIEKKFEEIDVTETFKKKAMDELKLNKMLWQHISRRTFTFFKYFPAFWSVKMADGKIYVATYKTKTGKAEFIILDLEGNILKKVFLPVTEVRPGNDKLFHFDNGKYYTIVENEDTEEWELHVHTSTR